MGRLKIVVGNITSDEILAGHDLIINPTNPQMVAGAGVSGSIFKKAGVDILESYTEREYGIYYFTDNYNEKNIMKVGDVRITPGFGLNMDIMFVQGPKAYDYENLDRAKRDLLDVYSKMIRVAHEKGYKNILCPSLGTGSYGFEHKNIAKDVIETIKNDIADVEINVDLVLYNEEELSYYEM